MASRRGAPSGKVPRLPDGFKTVQDIIEGDVPVNKLASVIGLVKDYRLPMRTGGTDWKCSLTLYDKTTEETDEGLVVNVFRPEKEMPQPNAGDVIIVRSAKVQDRNGISLITNRQTMIHVYSSVQIPKPPASAHNALQPPCGLNYWKPDAQVHEYVPWLYHATNKLRIPEQDEFRARVEGSLNIREKFSTLDKVREGRFCDLIVQVVKDPFDEPDKVNMWVTDYTENPEFFLYSWEGAKGGGGGEYDQNLYTPNGWSREWPGPFGKRSMQISCWSPHAEFISANVTAGDWVRLLNVHIKFGRNGNNLEGFLHEDRNHSGGRIQVEVLRITDRDNLDDRLKDAIKRKRAYEKSKKKQQKSYEENEQDARAGVKRKANNEEPAALNARARRTLQREGREKLYEEKKRQKEELIGLNKHIRCESETEPVTAVSTIVEPVPWTTTIEGQQVTLELPFICAKYRANVRVIDFRPRRLEDFAAWRKVTEYDALSDCSGSNSDEDAAGTESDASDAGASNVYRGRRIWEWRFALLLEGVDDKGKPEPEHDGRLWAVVDNNEAQQLFNLDACDLRSNQETLSALREQLFKLWGNLEEVKSKALLQEEEQRPRPRPAARLLAAQQPPPHSSPPVGAAAAAAGGDGGRAKAGDTEQGQRQGPGQVSNKPFTCCLRQYGVKVRERDPRRANAGPFAPGAEAVAEEGQPGPGAGRRWQRVFGLFGTRIVS